MEINITNFPYAGDHILVGGKEVKELYDTNKEFREYVNRYAICNHISVEEALTHALVAEYANYIQSQH